MIERGWDWETERLHGLAESEMYVRDAGHGYDAVRRDEEAGDTRSRVALRCQHCTTHIRSVMHVR